MKRIALLVAVVLLIAACGDDDATSTSTAAPTTTEAATTTAAPATTEAADTTTTEAAETTLAATEGGLRITTVSFNDPMVVITNVGPTSVSLDGYWLCQRPAYQPLPDIEIGAGESLAISLGGSVFLPPPGALTIDGPLSLGPVVVAGGEVALYKSNSFSSASDIVSYVEWGVPGHGRSSVAIEAGIWGPGEFVPTFDGTPAISVFDFDAVGATAWSALTA